MGVWTTDVDNAYFDASNETIDTFAELKLLGITAWCLKWELNAPVPASEDATRCEEFFYQSSDGQIVNATSVLEDCSIVKDNSVDLGGQITAWLIVSCFGIGLCVFIFGSYREYVLKRRSTRKRKISVVRGHEETRLNTKSQIASNQAIEELDEPNDETNQEEDDEKQETEEQDSDMKPILFVSKGDARPTNDPGT